MKTLLRTIGILTTGVLSACAFPPFDEYFAAYIGLIPLIVLALHTDPRRSFRWGFGAGCVFWLLSVSWILRLSATGGPLVPVFFGWLLLSGYCALYFGAFAMTAAWLFRRVSRGSDRPFSVAAGAVLTILLAVLWVGFEFLRSRLFTGFPWNTLGVSQYRNLGMIQIAEWGGVYAVSFVVMLMNTGLALTIASLVRTCRGGAERRRVHVELMLGLLALALCLVHGTRRVRRLDAGASDALSWRVAAVQPNVGQLEKWTPAYEMEIQRTLLEQSEYAAQFRPGLIVWPETAVPGDALADSPTARLIEAVTEHGVPLLAGAMEAVVEDEREHYYNSALLFGTGGRLLDVYRKQHLVLFGEYLPFDRHLPFLKTLAPLGISCSAGATGTVFRLEATRSRHEKETAPANREVRFTSLICFEDVFPELARRAVRNGARLLVNQTNDAWFDGWLMPGWAARQHMSHCVFRCIENRVPAVRCANTGVTCFIDRAGRIDDLHLLEKQRWKMGVTGFSVREVRVPAAAAKPSFYNRYGDMSLALPAGITAALAFILAVADERRKNTAP